MRFLPSSCSSAARKANSTTRLLRSSLNNNKRLGSSPKWLAATGAYNNSNNNNGAGSRRYISSEDESFFQEVGYLDKDGLTAFDTLHEMQFRSCKVYEGNELFGTYQNESERFEYMTYGEYDQQVDTCRKVLVDLGIQKYDKVALISNNRWEWATIAAATYSLSATLVPMYEAQLEADWTYILNDSGSRVVFCASQDIFDRVQSNVLPNTPSVQASICLGEPGVAATGEEEDYVFSKLMATAASRSTMSSLVLPPTPEDLADLIYTSGTTGQPKGVELTHANLTSNVKASRAMEADPKDFVREEDRTLAFLPWAHSYGQTCELWMGIAMGAGMAICRGVPFIVEDLQLAKPTSLISVPTLYKKVYDGVHNVMENANPIRKSLMRSALDLGAANAEYRNGNRGPLGPIDWIKFKMLDKIVLSKIRDRFGGRMRQGFVASAACPTEVMKFMDSLGIPICEGYGLTETSPVITINVPSNRSVGSVGLPVKDVDVYVVDEYGNPLPPGEEGEICCAGPNVMRGYYNNPEATAEVISVAPDGVSRMFHTGDLGQLDANGWLKVTGRLKEQYKLDNGKYIVPTPVETAIGTSRFIHQNVLYGANRPHNIVLLVPEWDAIRTELGFDEASTEEDMARDPRVTDLIDAELAKSCSKIKKFEVPQKWAFVAPFTAANNMLTPKMSVRRHKVIEAYEDVISVLYGEHPVATGSAQAKDEGHHREAA